MDNERGIHPQTVPDAIQLITPENRLDDCVTELNPAKDVMTDLSKVTPFQIDVNTQLNDINDKMIAFGVRLLFVNNTQGQLAGIITSTDTLGEKPLLIVKDNGIPHNEITAQDLMTPISKLEGIPYEQVERANVADIVEALKDCRRHHMLVLENRDSSECVRGLFSITQISKQLGSEVTPNERAQNFAELNKALS